MSFAGLKKQLNKVNQFVTEKVGVAEGTQMDDDIQRMEHEFNATCDLVTDLQSKTKEYLQPNPSARAMMATVKGISALSGQTMDPTYPQPEGIMGECLTSHGCKLGDDSTLGVALLMMGESMKQMADAKYALDEKMRQNFLEPLHQLETRELKEVGQLRKKMESRRLDYDGKRRKQAKANSPGVSSRNIADEEIKLAEQKFAESLQHAQVGMHTVLETEAEHIARLEYFAGALVEYHKKATGLLQSLVTNLRTKRDEAENRPKAHFVPKTLEDLKVKVGGTWKGLDDSPPPYSPTGSKFYDEGPPSYSPPVTTTHVSSKRASSQHNGFTPVAPPRRSPAATPSCTAIYKFEPEKAGDLRFKPGDTITLIKEMDDNWYEGSLNGCTGVFPKSFVKVIVPLP